MSIATMATAPPTKSTSYSRQTLKHTYKVCNTEWMSTGSAQQDTVQSRIHIDVLIFVTHNTAVQHGRNSISTARTHR